MYVLVEIRNNSIACLGRGPGPGSRKKEGNGISRMDGKFVRGREC